MLREEVPQVRLGGSRGGLGTATLEESILGYRNAVYVIKSADGFAPELIKTAVDGWFNNKFASVSSSQMGSRENGAFSCEWPYHHKKSGIVGRLTI